MHELPEEKQLAHPVFVRGVDQVVLDLQILEEELDWPIVVRLDSADLGRRYNDNRGLFPGEEFLDRWRFVRSSSALVRVNTRVKPSALSFRSIALPTRPRCPAMKIDSFFFIKSWAASVQRFLFQAFAQSSRNGHEVKAARPKDAAHSGSTESRPPEMPMEASAPSLCHAESRIEKVVESA